MDFWCSISVELLICDEEGDGGPVIVSWLEFFSDSDPVLVRAEESELEES